MDKKQIVVFDFMPDDCVHTADAIRQWHGAGAATITEHTHMQEFVHDFNDRHKNRKPYDMAFIGIEDMMGVETARNIRELDSWCPLFLVSTVDDFSIEGFRLHALDYLLKPVSPERIGRAVQRIGNPCQAGAQWP
ncbi:hypothetical protein LJC56_11935 [Christensenellaceae bacterium OttesenSCG-928-K19]|nr:hypothetical protein [Christensenellaceae bacterium OttesenSCG-928-K19]